MQYRCFWEEKESQPITSIHTRTALENMPQVLGKAYKAITNYYIWIALVPDGL